MGPVSTWQDILKRYGLSTLIALILLWFFLGNMAQALKDHDQSMKTHDSNTVSLLLRICINTANIAKTTPSECFRP